LRSILARLARGFARLWKWSNVVRVAILNALFFAIVVTLLVVGLRSDAPDFADDNALVLAPKGTIVEQLSGGGPSLSSLVTGGPEQETLLRDIVETIERAGEDDRIDVLVLDLAELRSAGVSKLQEIAVALAAFRAHDKKVIATADSYSQAAYYLAAHADEVYMHQMGEVGITGLGRYHMYFKDALDRFEVQWHIFRVGKYKSAVEPYIANEMSAEAREADLAWMGDLWAAWVADVAAARGITEANLVDYAQNFDAHVVRANGDTAAAAVAAGLVDHTGGRDVVRDRLIALVGEDPETHDFHRIEADEYLAFAREESPRKSTGDKVSVIVARGTIVDGKAPAGTIGGDSTAELIRKARLDEDTKALVLRVDSGRPASPWWCRWARWRPRAATGSAPRPTRSGRAPPRSRARSASSGCSPPSSGHWPSSSGCTATVSRPRRSPTSRPTAPSTPRWPVRCRAASSTATASSSPASRRPAA
jgi:protease IV